MFNLFWVCALFHLFFPIVISLILLPILGNNQRSYVNEHFLPFSKVWTASDGSHCRHSSLKCRKLFTCTSSWPSTGKTNCDENVLPSKSVIFRKASNWWVSIVRLIECANASLKINYANYNCECESDEYKKKKKKLEEMERRKIRMKFHRFVYHVSNEFGKNRIA